MHPTQNLQFEVHIKSAAELADYYLPFIKGGGLFIATNEKIGLNEPVTVNLQLFDDNEILFAHGHAVLINPSYSLDKLPIGIGVQFAPSDAKIIKDKVEIYLST